MNDASFQEDTSDITLNSWIPSANEFDTDFPIQNLPFGVYRNHVGDESRIGVAIGDQVLDLNGVADAGLLAQLNREVAEACRRGALNPLASLARSALAQLRKRLSHLLRSTALLETQDVVSQYLLPLREVELQLPFAIGDYSDFYSSIDHATRVGEIFRPDAPLLPNYKHVPIAYHGRASSVVVSGTAVHRPSGQRVTGDGPIFAPTERLDYEAEIGLFIGAGNLLGSPIALGDAERHMFGVCLLNDWSARDVQAWEYQPLGPFLGKSFATTLSPWVVTMDALAPFRSAARTRSTGDPIPMAYLADAPDRERGNLAIQIEVRLQTAAMRARNEAAFLLSKSNTSDLYWTPAQWIAHHTSNGCNLRPGDLLGSGTVSGADDTARACLLELTNGGVHPVRLPNGEERLYLQDGDEVILTARCERSGYRSIGFGSCRAMVKAAQR